MNERQVIFSRLASTLAVMCAMAIIVCGCTGSSDIAGTIGAPAPISIDMRLASHAAGDPELVIPSIIPSDAVGTVGVIIANRSTGETVYSNSVDYQSGGIMVRNVSAGSTYSVSLEVRILDFPASGENYFAGTAEVFVHDIDDDIFRDAPPEKRYSNALVYLSKIGQSAITSTPVMFEFAEGIPDEVVSGSKLPTVSVRPLGLFGNVLYDSRVLVKLTLAGGELLGTVSAYTGKGAAVFSGLVITAPAGTDVYLSAGSGFIIPASKKIRVR